MGSMSDILNRMPGLSGKVDESQIDEKAIDRTEAIILSMTKKERNDPSILNASRKRRIAAGSGTSVQEVNKLLKQFEMMQQLTKRFARGKMPKAMRQAMSGGDVSGIVGGQSGMEGLLSGRFGGGGHSAGRQRKSNKRKKKH